MNTVESSSKISRRQSGKITAPPAGRIAFFFATAALLPMALAEGSSGADEPKAVASVEDLWRGFDPEALPLEVETIRSWEEDGVIFQTLRFTGEVAKGAKVRVYAIQGAPRDGRGLPGVLHVHGGGQTASPDWVRFWAKRGYVCVSFDFCGRWEKRADFTDWGPIHHGNMAQAAGGFQLRPSPRESSWYHWALVSRRALTLLARHPQADPKRLGVFGVSVGGSLTWMIAGTDRRVKAAVPIYGCGYNYDRRNARWGLLVPNDDYNLFQRVLSPEAHAPLVSCPTLFLSATNDGHGLMDRAYDALAATTGPAYQAFSPRTDHHVEPSEGRDLPLWMGWHLKGEAPWPQPPALRLTLDKNGVPEAVVTSDAGADVRVFDVYYCLGDKRPQARFWRKAVGARGGKEWHASLPVMDAWDDMRAFANVTYRSGVCLSTPLRHAIPAQLGRARATLTWQSAIDDGANGAAHWKYLGAYTDPSLNWTHLKYGRDEQAGPFVAFDPEHVGATPVVQLYTHVIGDPQFQGRPGRALSFRVRGGFTEDGLTLTVIEQERSLHARNYSAAVPGKELGPGWREVVLPLTRFADRDKRCPARWQDLDRIEVRGRATPGEPTQFARFRWVDAPNDKPSP